MSRQRILHVIWTARTGGIASVVLQLLENGQSRRELEDLEPAIMMGKKTGDMLPEFLSSGVAVYDAGLKGGMDLRPAAYKRCKAIFDSFDILHFHSFNPLMALAACNSKAKTVYTEHGNFGLGRRPQAADMLIRFLQKRFLNRCVKAVTFNSGFTQRLSISRFGLERPLKRMIPNGIRPLKPNRDAGSQFKAMKSDGILIASIGRLAAVKRFDRLIDAFSAASPGNSRLVILGSGPEKRNLLSMIAASNMTDRISIVEKGNVHDLLATCDYCVLPSSGEAFGLVVLEAYQHGKKVLVFPDGGGARELVEEVEPDAVVADVAELSEKILQYDKRKISVENDGQRKEMRKRHAQKYSIDRMHDAFNELYSEI